MEYSEGKELERMFDERLAVVVRNQEMIMQFLQEWKTGQPTQPKEQGDKQ